MSNLLWEHLREGCGTCRYALRMSHRAQRPDLDHLPSHWCRRYPPTIVPTGGSIGGSSQGYPEMYESAWCGEFKREAPVPAGEFTHVPV